MDFKSKKAQGCPFNRTISPILIQTYSIYNSKTWHQTKNKIKMILMNSKALYRRSRKIKIPQCYTFRIIIQCYIIIVYLQIRHSWVIFLSKVNHNLTITTRKTIIQWRLFLVIIWKAFLHKMNMQFRSNNTGNNRNV